MTTEMQEELERASVLHEKGILTDEEFNAQKANILSKTDTFVPHSTATNISQSNIETFLVTNTDCFDPLQFQEIRNAVVSANESTQSRILLLPIKKPSQMFWIAFFLGAFGADRFMLNQTGIGFLKLIVGWLSCGIWWLGDLFTIKKRTWQYNYNIIKGCL